MKSKKSDQKFKGSVKIMLSYNYNHFEVALSSDEPMTLKEIDTMRKKANMMADKAVTQYEIAKRLAEAAQYRTPAMLRDEAERIIAEIETPNQSPEQKAIVKAWKDAEYRASRYDDYEDEDDFLNI
jgi:hypothetical protein